MPPRENQSSIIPADTLQERAAIELESMRNGKQSPHNLHPLPHACFHLLKSLPGNQHCLDCGSRDPDWATVSYGALICMRCTARHRGLGVQFSSVRSLTLDHWSHEQVLSMLEGGNKQLNSFFERHALDVHQDEHADIFLQNRYRTKAARFYRENMGLHVAKVKGSGIYQGRGVWRQSTTSTCSQSINQEPCQTPA